MKKRIIIYHGQKKVLMEMAQLNANQYPNGLRTPYIIGIKVIAFSAIVI